MGARMQVCPERIAVMIEELACGRRSMSTNDPQNQTALWRSRVWDTPTNGARYYVALGERYAEDKRGNVWTGTREQAKRLAGRLNEQGITNG